MVLFPDSSAFLRGATLAATSARERKVRIPSRAALRIRCCNIVHVAQSHAPVLHADSNGMTCSNSVSSFCGIPRPFWLSDQLSVPSLQVFFLINMFCNISWNDEQQCPSLVPGCGSVAALLGHAAQVSTEVSSRCISQILPYCTDNITSSLLVAPLLEQGNAL